MHCMYRGKREYQDLLDAGCTKGIAYSVFAYGEIGWSSLKRRNRLDVIRYRKPSPDVCPHCHSERKLHLYNISNKYLDDDSDYEWCCRSCGMLKYQYKKEAGTSRRMLRAQRKEALNLRSDKADQPPAA